MTSWTSNCHVLFAIDREHNDVHGLVTNFTNYHQTERGSIPLRDLKIKN